MSKQCYIFLFLCASLISVVGCTESRIRKELKKFTASEVVVPSDMLKILPGNISVCGNASFSKATLIIYYDSTDCTECRIAHLDELFPIYDLTDKYDGFEVMTVFSPSLYEYDITVENIIKSEFRYPLYVDMNGCFIKANSFIPVDDKLYHSFLVDSKGKPVLVGYPLASSEMWRLFNDTLSHLVTE